MKSLIASIIIFSILLILVITNSIYIHISCDELLSISSSLTVGDEQGARRLYDVWKRHQPLYGISMHDSHVDKITELVENIKSAVTLGNGAEFDKNIILLNELLNELKKIEEISLQGII